MFNPVLKEYVLVQKHPGMCAFEELSYREPKRVVQNEKNNRTNISRNYHNEIKLKELVK